jgi:hypothetical protein
MWHTQRNNKIFTVLRQQVTWKEPHGKPVLKWEISTEMTPEKWFDEAD